MNSTQGDNRAATDAPERRSFLTRGLAVLVGSLVAIFPFAAGSGVLLNPLRRKRAADNDQSDGADFIRVCSLNALPPDGSPHQFVVTTDVTDAWTRAQNQRVGSVFLSRTDSDGKPQVVAFTSTCPHLGCAVEFDAGRDRFECPCHESGFGKDGAKLFGPSLRGLDPLEVKLAGDEGAQEVLVAYRWFRAGVAERIPVG
jgi:nitrite reductase/ring-hydroxylating ferredoxin subunit